MKAQIPCQTGNSRLGGGGYLSNYVLKFLDFLMCHQNRECGQISPAAESQSHIWTHQCFVLEPEVLYLNWYLKEKNMRLESVLYWKAKNMEKYVYISWLSFEYVFTKHFLDGLNYWRIYKWNFFFKYKWGFMW